jgi:hypothetical protein
MNWVIIFNRLFELIDQDETLNYFSGPRSMRKVREVNPCSPTYQQFIEQRRAEQRSTTRRDYYYDILLAFDEAHRIGLIYSILNDLDEIATGKAGELRAILGGAVAGPVAVVPDHG